MRMLFLLVTAALALISSSAIAQSRTPEAGRPLLELLSRGGYVLFMRHAHADVGEDNYANKEYWKDCAEQRRLSTKGALEAATVGAFIRAHGIPVSRVSAGNLCRAQRTAELLRLGPVQTSESLNDFKTWTAMGRDKAELVEAYRRELASPPPLGTNSILVSHAQRGTYIAHPVLDLIEMGTIAVFRPTGPNAFELVAIIRSADWQYLGVAEIPSLGATAR